MNRLDELEELAKKTTTNGVQYFRRRDAATVLKLIAVAKAAKLFKYQQEKYGCDDITYAPVAYEISKALTALEKDK